MIDFQAKASALLAAYKVKFSYTPTRHEALLIMSVALHETSLGDAWNHSANWGAIQRPGNHSTIPRDPFEQPHGDSSPGPNGQQRYTAWFWCFPQGVPCPLAGGLSGDAAGAWMLLDVLLVNRSSIAPIISHCTPYDLAAAMYRTGYYEGFHSPILQPGESRDASGLTPGQLANIRDYAGALSQAFGQLSNALATFDPLGPPPDPFDLDTIVGWQKRLNLARASVVPLAPDGLWGAKSALALKAFQAAHGLKVDGIRGPLSRAALEAATLVAAGHA